MPNFTTSSYYGGRAEQNSGESPSFGETSAGGVHDPDKSDTWTIASDEEEGFMTVAHVPPPAPSPPPATQTEHIYGEGRRRYQSYARAPFGYSDYNHRSPAPPLSPRRNPPIIRDADHDRNERYRHWSSTTEAARTLLTLSEREIRRPSYPRHYHFSSQGQPSYHSRDGPLSFSREQPGYATRDHQPYSSRDQPSYSSQHRPSYATRDSQPYSSEDRPSYVTQDRLPHLFRDEMPHSYQSPFERHFRRRRRSMSPDIHYSYVSPRSSRQEGSHGDRYGAPYRRESRW